MKSQTNSNVLTGPALAGGRNGMVIFCGVCALLTVGGAFTKALGQGFVYENAWEMQSDGDFDGDSRRDLVIVDKLTGDYRVGYQLSPSAYTWISSRASGIANATGLGIGKLD